MMNKDRIDNETAAKLSLLAAKHATRIPRSCDGYAADVANREASSSRRLDAIAMIGRHCPEFAADAYAILSND